jgi:hypothetical protein
MTTPLTPDPGAGNSDVMSYLAPRSAPAGAEPVTLEDLARDLPPTEVW